MLLSWKPCSAFRSKLSVRDCGTLKTPLRVSLWRWSLSERARSARRLKLSIGELKKALPVLSIALDQVYEKRPVIQLEARCCTESVMPL